MVKYLLFQENSQIILPGNYFPIENFFENKKNYNFLLATTQEKFPNKVLLPDGVCDLVHLTFIFQKEYDWIKKNSFEKFMKIAKEKEFNFLIDQNRPSLI